VGYASCGKQDYCRENAADNKSGIYRIPCVVFYVPGHNDSAVSHNRADAEPLKFFGRGKRNTGVKMLNLENEYENRQILPVSDKGFKIDWVITGLNPNIIKSVNPYPEKSPPE
jgi:hypothetical protein